MSRDFKFFLTFCVTTKKLSKNDKQDFNYLCNNYFKINSTKIQNFNPYSTLIFTPEVFIILNFLVYNTKKLTRLSCTLVEPLFNNFIPSYFSMSLLAFIDDFVTFTSAGYLFFSPTLKISFADKLDPFSSSLTTEYYEIINVLQFISSSDHSKIVIVSDFQSCLLIVIQFFNSPLSLLVLIIKSLIFYPPCRKQTQSIPLSG